MSICNQASDRLTEDHPPLLRVVSGSPTPDELAALVGVLLSLQQQDTTPADADALRWARSGHPANRAVHASGLPVHRGTNAWRRSGLPI